MRYLRLVFLFLLVSVAMVACQKDESVDPAVIKKLMNADSSAKTNLLNAPGSFLAVKGSLKVTVDDSTYTFDAEKDSIAFVNVALDSTKYFGITAINKAHTISFGISSEGVAASEVNSAIAGSQLLFNKGDKAVLQYTLSKNQKDAGKINLAQYLLDSTSTKGTFYTSLAKEGNTTTEPAKVVGSFNLKLK